MEKLLTKVEHLSVQRHFKLGLASHTDLSKTISLIVNERRGPRHYFHTYETWREAGKE
jgi:hypothetical protein